MHFRSIFRWKENGSDENLDLDKETMSEMITVGVNVKYTFPDYKTFKKIIDCLRQKS